MDATSDARNLPLPLVLAGSSPRIRELLSVIDRIAKSDAAVLISGETGTGKEVVARAIHEASARAAGPFVVFDLLAVGPRLLESELFGRTPGHSDEERPGAFASADGGTIFLDEIGALDETSQPRLLRAIERREIEAVDGYRFRSVDVRVVAATNRDLHAEVTAGRFRADLFHRLAVVCLDVPPLRERREDIPLLVDRILGELAAASGTPAPAVSREAIELLCQYDWPGNIRELRNVLQRALSVAPDASVLGWELFRLEQKPSKSGTYRLDLKMKTFKEAKDQLLDEWESEYLREVLERAGGNMTLAAQYAGIARGHLYRLMKKRGLCR
jgi:DNA-binding NtrC family response regulator